MMIRLRQTAAPMCAAVLATFRTTTVRTKPRLITVSDSQEMARLTSHIVPYGIAVHRPGNISKIIEML